MDLKQALQIAADAMPGVSVEDVNPALRLLSKLPNIVEIPLRRTRTLYGDACCQLAVMQIACQLCHGKKMHACQVPNHALEPTAASGLRSLAVPSRLRASAADHRERQAAIRTLEENHE